MTHLFSLSNAISFQVHLRTPLGNSFFVFPSTLLANSSLRSTASLTSYFPPGYFTKQILPSLPSTSLLFSALLYPASSIPVFSSSLSATLPSLCLHSLPHPTHSEEPPAHLRTSSSLNDGFAFFSNILPFTSFAYVPQRSLPRQLYGNLLKPYLSMYLNKSNHSYPSPLLFLTFSSFFSLPLL